MNLKKLLCSLILLYFLPINAQVSQNGLLEVDGNVIRNANNAVFSTAGNSIYWSGFQAGVPFYQPEVVNFLASDWNAGIVRAAMAVEESDGSGVSPFDSTLANDIIALRDMVDTSAEGYFRNPERELAKVRAVIEAAIANDVYVIVDFHTHFAHLLEPEAIEFFTTIATEYGDNDHIIYEIFNEPIGLASFRSGANDSAAFGQFDQTWNQIIRPYAVTLINTIRAIDPDNLIVVGTPGFDQGVIEASNNRLIFNDLTQANRDSGAILNVAYALHFYAGTHGGFLRGQAQQALNNGIALFATEWGTVEASGDGQVNLGETMAWMNFLRTNNISHANWSVTDLAEGASVVQPDTGTQGLFNGDLTGTGELVRCIIQNWDASSFGDCDLGPGGSGGGPIKVEVETPVGTIDPNSGANSDFRSDGLGTGFRPDGESIVTGFVNGTAVAFRLNNIQAGNNFTIEVEFSSSDAGFDMILERNAGTTVLQTLPVPDTGDLDNYQVLTFTGIPFDPNNEDSDIAIAITNGNPEASINIESFTYTNEDLVMDEMPIDPCSGVTTTFDGTSWSPNPPTAIDRAIIAGDYDTVTDGGDIIACVIEINENTILTVQDDTFIETLSDIVVRGTLNITSSGSVVQLDNRAEVVREATGEISVTKTTPLLAPRDFILLSSPMTGETNGNVYGAADRVFKIIPENFIPNTDTDLDGVFANFIDDNGDYIDNLEIDNPNLTDDATGLNNPINPMEGYLVFPQAVTDTETLAYTHTYNQGTLNNGILSRSIVYNGPQTNNNFNLLGNPYPSAINTDTFIRLNPAVNEVYYWEHITVPNENLPGSFNDNFSMNDVSVRNLIGGLPAVNAGPTGVAPGEFMASAQGFAILANQNVSLANVSFNNSMRVRDNNDVLRSNELDNKIWLRIAPESYDIQSTTGIGFMPEASQDFDPGYDTPRINTDLSLFSNSIDGDQLAIQGRETFDRDMEISLGFETRIDTPENYTISLSSFEGAALDQHGIILIDNVLGTITNLKNKDYTFTTSNTVQPNRFTIAFEGEVLSTENITLDDTLGVFPNPAQNQVNITFDSSQQVNNIALINLNGSIIRSFDITSSQSAQALNISNMAPGIYLIRVEGTNAIVTRKLVVR